MKRILLLVIATVFVTTFYSCTETNTEPDFSSLCNNGLKDGEETEVDCGGDCDSCPPYGVVHCDLGNTVFNSTAANVTFGQILGNSIRIFASDGRPMYFMFKPEPIGQPASIFALSADYRGEAYTLEPGDMGEVVITEVDTVRNMLSGTFWFTAGRVTGPDTTSARNGVFTNVRLRNI